MAPRKFRMRNIVEGRLEENKTTNTADIIYTIRWVNYPRPEDYTEESRAFVIAHGGQGLIRTFEAWNRYELETGEGRMTRDEWENLRATRRLAANSSGTCLVKALRTSTKLAGIDGFCSKARLDEFAVTTVRPKANMMWEDAGSLIRFCNKEQAKASLPQIAFTGKKDNLLKGTHTKYVNHRLNAGVYLCCGITVNEAAHCFVLECLLDGRVIMHGSVDKTWPTPYNEQSASWIRRWKFVLPINQKKP